MSTPTFYDIACYFCVSHIADAASPGTRLNNILDRMHRGRPLTTMSMNYLLQRNLDGLHQLASGLITYEAYIAALDPALVAREREGQIRAAENLARQVEAFAGHRRRHGRAARVRAEPSAGQAIQLKETRAAAMARQAEQEAQRKRERDAEQAAFAARFAEQCQRNRESAAALCQARLSESGELPGSEEIARHFSMQYVPNALQRPLANILEVLYWGQPVAMAYLNYLEAKGLHGLYQLAIGQTTHERYMVDPSAFQARITAKEAKRLARLEAYRREREEAEAARVEAYRRKREEAEAARIARESDPAYILRRKYGVADIEQPLLQRMMEVLQHIDSGNRLSEADFAWLTTKAKAYFSEPLLQAYHLHEAGFCTSEYRRTQDPWNAVNASGHYRKCDGQQTALELLDSVPANRQKQPKLKSALLTTRGGVLRDLGRRREALQLGEQAHALQPRNFRPCTLLGALHMELGNFAEGQEWYAKAEERGASQQSIDSELRRIFQRADKTRRTDIKAFLLADDPHRYRWVNDSKYWGA